MALDMQQATRTQRTPLPVLSVRPTALWIGNNWNRAVGWSLVVGLMMILLAAAVLMPFLLAAFAMAGVPVWAMAAGSGRSPRSLPPAVRDPDA